jgi:hypothetical protein
VDQRTHPAFYGYVDSMVFFADNLPDSTTGGAAFVERTE